jgi:bifunctional DNase/RNase
MIEMTVDMERSITSLTPDQKSKQQMIWLRSVEHQMVIPMVIGMTEAMSIFSALTGEPPMRPLTHDLVRTILDQFDGQVERVEIVDLKKGIFCAELVLLNRGKQLRLDARPSDSIALALRYKAPIFMSEEVLMEAGYKEGQAEPEIEGEDLVMPEEWELPDIDDTDKEMLMAVEEALDDIEQPDPELLIKPEGKIETLRKEMEKASKQERYEEAGRLRDEIARLSEKKRVN